MSQLQVGLEERAYPIIIEQGCLAKIGEDLLKRNIGNKYCIVADAYVAELYSAQLIQYLEKAGIRVDILTFPRGEASKTLATVAELCSGLAQKGFDRRDCIIALGGGVSGDIAGFLASSYMRGIPFVQVPTTLLAQVDSSVGGKTGVDLPEGKNLVGAFYQPKAVYIDIDVLNTLERDELLGGLAEVIKYGVIWDHDFFTFLADNVEEILSLKAEVIERLITTCCEIKAEVVAKDERESDLRRILNYGHTIGHAVESVSEFSIIHGMAVAIGMVAAAKIAVGKGLLLHKTEGEILNLIKKYNLPTSIPAEYDRNVIKRYLLADKKSIDGKVTFVLPTEIGKVVMRDDVEENLVDAVMR
jgi:3-dehydroquinate synthase